MSAFIGGHPNWRIQETAFTGLWRIIKIGDDQAIIGDRLEISFIPVELLTSMRHQANPNPPVPVIPPDAMNAPSLIEEIRARSREYQAGDPPHCINLTLLPVNETDLDLLYGWLGHQQISILSRGYGNCRVTSTCLENVWWVQYFNSMDTLILNSIEITEMPEIVLASREDLEDLTPRLREYRHSLGGISHGI